MSGPTACQHKTVKERGRDKLDCQKNDAAATMPKLGKADPVALDKTLPDRQNSQRQT